MIKCIYNECQWPECDKTCGMVPIGDYVVGSSAEEQLIHHLQERIAELLVDREGTRAMLYEVERIVKQTTRQCDWGYDEDEACAKVCLYGYTDCIRNPEYLRRHHKEWWKELGMPTRCTEENCYYDDEDK